MFLNLKVKFPYNSDDFPISDGQYDQWNKESKYKYCYIIADDIE